MALRIYPRFRELCSPAWLQAFKNTHPRYNSSLPEAAEVSAPRTSVQNPSDHSTKHLGLWYSIEPDVVRNVFGGGGIPRSYVTMAKTFQETSLMVRQPALTVIDYIKRSNLNLPANKFLLYGRHGVGKTLSLTHILHFLAEDGWLLLHVWWAPLWRRNGKGITPSSTNPGCFDHPQDAAVWLQHFRTQNAGLLNKLQLKTIVDTYTWSRRESTELGSPITALIEHGINRTRYATDAVLALTSELKQHANDGRCKVALVVDGINTFFCKTTTHRLEGGVYVDSDKFMLFKGFTHFFNNDWKNGCIVGTLDATANDGRRRESHLPRYLLRQKGWEALDPFVPVLVKDYNDMEMRSIIDYYIDRNWIQTVDASSEIARQELASLSNNNPWDLMTLCRAI